MHFDLADLTQQHLIGKSGQVIASGREMPQRGVCRAWKQKEKRGGQQQHPRGDKGGEPGQPGAEPSISAARDLSRALFDTLRRATDFGARERGDRKEKEEAKEGEESELD